MKITKSQLRNLINEVYKDYESQKQGERARLNIPGLQGKLSSAESSGEWADMLNTNQLAMSLGSREPDLQTKQLKFNFEFEYVKNKAKKYLQSILDYCDWVNSSDERFTPEDKETIRQFRQRMNDLGREYKNLLFDLHKDLSKRKVVDDQGRVTFGTPEQHEFYMIINYYISRPFDDHGSLLAAIAKEEPKYSWMGRPVKPNMCQDMYMQRLYGPYLN